jgi:hypothetical protein
MAWGFKENDVRFSGQCHWKNLLRDAVTGGIILTRLTEAEKQRLLKEPGVGYFKGHGRTMKKWVRIPVSSPSDIDTCIPSIRSSYKHARDAAT